MSLLPLTQGVLRAVEEATGRPVIIQPKTSMGNLLAKITIARGSAVAHIVAYNPSAGASADYVICFEAGFLLRMFQIPESDRFALAGSEHGKQEIEKAVADHFQQKGMSQNKEVRAGLQERFLGGILQQLRSMPIGLRVDTWIRQNYPSLDEQQKKAIVQQLNDNATSLGPQVRQIAPASVLRANIGMNAAFALFWSRTWGDPLLAVPYKASGQLATGEELLRKWDEIPNDSVNDKKLIDSWANHVGLSGWYQFISYT